jgi:hypothetical protein
MAPQGFFSSSSAERHPNSAPPPHVYSEAVRAFVVASLLLVGAWAIVPSAVSYGAPPDAGAPSTTPAHVTPPALDDVEHMCALLTGCDRLPLPAGLVPHDFVGCVRTLYEELTSPSAVTFSLTLKECGLRSSSCGELGKCALRGAKPDICAGRGKGAPVDMCDGDGRAITCVNERVAGVRDCPRGGEQCVVREGKAQCALGGCEKEGPAACSASGTRILECKKGKLVSLDCGAFGLRCVSSADGPRCAPQTPGCGEKSARCEGGTAVGCWHGHEVRVDCGSAGLACAGGGNAIGACVTVNLGASKPASQCDPAAPAKCDGGNLKWCAWGTPRSYLCKSMGLSRCVADANGARCI